MWGWGYTSPMADDVEGSAPRLVRFGPFELDRRVGELRKNGHRVRLQDQPLRVLEALVAQPGELLPRETLRHRLWPDDTFVDFDNGVNRAVNRLRAALATRPRTRGMSRRSTAAAIAS
jgi:DNA-binding winged helix-turn-helix (wHTH) protein